MTGSQLKSDSRCLWGQKGKALILLISWNEKDSKFVWVGDFERETSDTLFTESWNITKLRLRIYLVLYLVLLYKFEYHIHRIWFFKLFFVGPRSAYTSASWSHLECMVFRFCSFVISFDCCSNCQLTSTAETELDVLETRARNHNEPSSWAIYSVCGVSLWQSVGLEKL